MWYSDLNKFGKNGCAEFAFPCHRLNRFEWITVHVHWERTRVKNREKGALKTILSSSLYHPSAL